MTSPKLRTSRKILVASIGVATMSYVISCGGGSGTNNEAGAPEGGGRADALDEFPIANLVARPDTGSNDGATIDDFPVANLVARPDSGIGDGATIDDFPVANLVAIPDVTTIDEFPVANLVVKPDF